MNALIHFVRDLFRSEAAEEREWGEYALEDLIECDSEAEDTPKGRADVHRINRMTPRQARRVRVRKERRQADKKE